MPTIFSHAIVAAAAGQWFPRRRAATPESRVPNPAWFWWWTVACALLPDADVIGFSFGIQYGDMFGHRGFTHSVFFAVLTGLVAAARLSRKGSKPGALGVGSWSVGVLWAWFTAVTLSHGVWTP